MKIEAKEGQHGWRGGGNTREECQEGTSARTSPKKKMEKEFTPRKRRKEAERFA